MSLFRDLGLRLDDGIKQIDGKVKATFHQAHSVYSKMGTDVRERFAGVNERLSKLEAAKHSSADRDFEVPMEFQPWFEGVPPRDAETPDRISTQISDLEAQLSRLEERLDSNLASAGSRAPLGEYDAMRMITQLESQLRELSQKVSGQQTFTAGGMTFNDVRDVIKFVEKYGIKDCGVYPDSFAILFLSRPTPGSGQEDAARVVSAKKAGRTAGESDILATSSLIDLLSSSVRPPILVASGWWIRTRGLGLIFLISRNLMSSPPP